MVKPACVVSSLLLVSAEEAVTLLQHNDARTSVGAHQHVGMEDFSAIINGKAKAVASGAIDPLPTDVVVGFEAALDVMAGQLAGEKVSSVQVWVAADSNVQSCNTQQSASFTGPDGVDALKQLAANKKATHANCRSTEDSLRGTENSACVGLDTYANNAKSADTMPTCVCGADLGTPSDLLACVKSTNAWATQVETELESKIGACSSAQQAADVKAATCDVDQTLFEGAACQYSSKLTSTCATAESCHQSTVLSRTATKVALQAKVASEKVMMEAILQMKCVTGLLKTGKTFSQEELQQCSTSDYNTSDLDISYPETQKIGCDDSDAVPKPGVSEWVVAEYASLAPTQSWLPQSMSYVGIEPVVACASSVGAAFSEWEDGTCRDLEAANPVKAYGGHCHCTVTSKQECLAVANASPEEFVALSLSPNNYYCGLFVLPQDKPEWVHDGCTCKPGLQTVNNYGGYVGGNHQDWECSLRG